MPKSGSLILLTCVLLMGLQIAQATPLESWRTTVEKPCTGLTVGWTPSLTVLHKIIGPNWQPAQGPTKNHGILLLFAVSCPSSRIGNAASGPFTIGALIVPVQTPKDTHGINQSNTHGWAVIPDVLGIRSSPVMQLFERHGFGTTDAKVALSVQETVKGKKVSMNFVMPGGRMEVHALISGSPKRFNVVSALASTHLTGFSVFAGPESAMRQSQGIATVTSTGKTWVSSLHLNAKPKMVMLDQGFVWDFIFLSFPK